MALTTLVTGVGPAAAEPTPGLPTALAYEVGHPVADGERPWVLDTVVTDAGLASSGYVRAATSFGDVVVTPDPGAWSASFVAQRGTDGSPHWVRRFGGQGTWLVGLGSTGDAVVTVGQFGSALDVDGAELATTYGDDAFLASHAAADGQLRWVTRVGFDAGNWCQPPTAAVSNDRVLVSGGHTGTPPVGFPTSSQAGGCQTFLAAYDATTGALEWARSLGSANVTRIATGARGQIVLGGWFHGTTSLGGDPMTSAEGRADAFLASLRPSGALGWQRQYGQGDTGDALSLSGLVVAGDVVLALGRAALLPDHPYGGLAAVSAVDGTTLWQTGAERDGVLAVEPVTGLVVVANTMTGSVYPGTDHWGPTIEADGSAWDVVVKGYRLSDGTYQYAGRLGGPEHDQVTAATVRGSEVVLSGRLTSSTGEPSDVVAVRPLDTGTLPALRVPSSAVVGDTVSISYTDEVASLRIQHPCLDVTGGGLVREVKALSVGQCLVVLDSAPRAGWVLPSLVRILVVDPAPSRAEWTTPPRSITYGEKLWSAGLWGVSFWGAHDEPVWGPIRYTPDVGAVLPVGRHEIVATLESWDYLPSSATTTVEVLPATPKAGTLSALTYGQPLGRVAFTGVDGRDVPGTATQSPQAGTVLHAGQHTVTVTFTSDSENYADTTVTRTVVVSKATPTPRWEVPAPIVYGTALGGTQLSLTATGIDGELLPGSSYYWPGRGAVLHAGAHSLEGWFVASDPASLDYGSVSVRVPLTVLRASTGLKPGTSLGTRAMTVELRDTSNAVPLAGRSVTFTSATHTCTVTTDTQGFASCSVPTTQLLEVLAEGFDVSFAGGPNHEPSTAHGTVL